jgi:hypothetical protein
MQIWSRAVALIDSIVAETGLPLDQVRRVAKKRMRLVIAQEWEGQSNRDAIITAVRAGDGVGKGARDLGPPCRMWRVRHIVDMGCPQADEGVAS